MNTQSTELELHIENLEYRILLSTVDVFAAGAMGGEEFDLVIRGETVASFTVSQTQEVFSHETAEEITADDVRIQFTNDLWDLDQGIDRNLIVDRITIDDVAYESEDPATIGNATWTGDGFALGNWESEELHANGYFQYSVEGATVTEDGGTIGNGSQNIVLIARGDEGTENLSVVANGQIVGEFIVSTTWATYTINTDDYAPGDDLRIEFTNDVWDPDNNIDANLYVDRVTVNGEVREIEDPTTFGFGTWDNGFVEGFNESEVLHTDGYFLLEFDGVSPLNHGEFLFSAESYSVNESAASIQIQIDRVGGTDGVVTVDYETRDVTTTALEDYVPVVGQLTFGDGQQSMLITVPVIQDPYAEDDETFAIDLLAPTGGATIGTSSIEVTIADDDTTDPAGLFRFSAPMYMVDEDGGEIQVTVIRDGGSSGDVTIDYATEDDAAVAGLDYSAVSGTLIFADGETEATITVPILDDEIAEESELFWMYLSNPTGGATGAASGAQLLINDNEPSPGSGDGLYGEYFDNVDFSGLALVRTDSRVAFNFGNGSPDLAIDDDTFSIRWTGEIETLYSETYTFETQSDDGIRLWVDDQLIIDNWTDHAATTDTGTIDLEAGQLYSIRMEYYENAGSAVAELRWSSASQEREIIPQSQLYSAGDFERNGSTYLLTPQQMTWSEAQDYANRLGGNLVTINDAAEEAWLQETFGTEVRLWTGLNDLDSEDSFVWASGEEVTYTNWAPSEPNDSGNEDFVVMNFGTGNQWNDERETAEFFGIIEVTGDSVPAQNSIFGSWGAPIEMPNIAVAAAQLPDGEIVTWSSWDRFDFGGNNPQTYTSVFNTATGEVDEFLITETQHDMFCPGTVMLSDGRILVNGGGSTVTSTSIYDFRTDTWTRIEDMNIRRWYNTSMTLGDGRVITWGGNSKDAHSSPAEVWEEGVGWSTIDNMDIDVYLGTGDQTSWHPQMFQAPNGKVFIAGPGPDMYWMDLDNPESGLEYAGTRPDGYSQHASYVMYDVGKILKFGGADAEANSGTVTNKAYVIDFTGDTAVVTETGEMSTTRKFHNGVVLPDGKVLAVGGNTSGNKFSDEGSVYFAEVWDPATGEWSVLDSMDVPRNYHSVALLQQDGTVFAAGGGLCGNCSANHSDAQVFSPGNLFDENGSFAERPVISSDTTEVDYGATLDLQVTSTDSVDRFNLIRMSTVTHSVNTDQRLVPVSFTDQGDGNFSLAMPADGNIAPPGYYMLFAIDADGTPSESHVLRIG